MKELDQPSIVGWSWGRSSNGSNAFSDTLVPNTDLAQPLLRPANALLEMVHLEDIWRCYGERRR